MRWYTAICRALVFIGGLAVAVVCVFILEAASQFDGSCGGFMPFLAAPRPCALSHYLWSSLGFSVSLLLGEYWGWVLLVVALVLCTSIAIERRRCQRNTA
jgi:hypothetical protein